MWTALRSLFDRAVGQLADDLRADPYLLSVFLLAAVLAGFWFWHRIPNFATRDEHSRLMDVLVAYGSVVADPGLEGLREGVLWGRAPFGATFYLFALAVLPMVLAAAALGRLDVLLAFVAPSREFGYYPSWHATPEWVWTWSIAAVRLVNVLFAVGVVYLTYRLGTAIRGRWTGRLAAVLLTITWGFLTVAHEGGEDMPATFFVILTLYLLYRYVETGETAPFYAASATGGVAIAFKLTAVPVVPLIGIAHVIGARTAWRGDRTAGETATTAGEYWTTKLRRPRRLAAGASIGLVTILLGFPTLLVGGVEPFLIRVVAGPAARATHATGPDAPVWWWFLRGYLNGLGLPLFLAAVAGVGASVVHLREARSGEYRGTVLVVALLATYVAMFSLWHDFRVHHLLPTFPLLAVLLAGTLDRFREDRPAIARPAMAVLLVTTGAYAVAGDLGYTSMPRDRATAWLTEHADENATMEVYRRNVQDAAVPHDMRINHLFGPEDPEETVVACPEYIQLGYRDLLYLDPETYYRNSPRRAAYVRSLLEEEYNYEIAAEFGPRPPDFVPRRPTPESLVDLVPVGVNPHTDQYADEQELAQNQYTIVLERSGPC